MASDTLLIRHLPISLSKNEIEDFLKHIGSTEVVIHESKIKKHSIAFAKFKDNYVAKEAMLRLHQQQILDSRLIVEYVDHKQSPDFKKREKEIEEQITQENRKSQLRETFLKNLNNWTIGLNVTLPPPYHLKYRYPPANSEMLRNIVNMLSYNTKFYTQVLHLMNKMNLPSPFEATFPLQENDVFSSFIIYVLENYVCEDTMNRTLMSEESELESDREDDDKTVIPQKRSVPPRKLLKKRKLFKPLITLSNPIKTNVKDVFESMEREIPLKKIEVKIPAEIPVTETAPTEDKTSSEGFGVIYPKPKIIENKFTEEESNSEEKCITAEELAANRIPEKNRDVLPIFKHYQPGVPSCRLYVKNLSKHVTLDDLSYIFKRFLLKGVDEQGLMFDIRLMQEGRMKGQAFITLQNVKQAELALKETNGFIIKDKPMVVQYARSAVAKDTTLNLSK